MASPGDVPPLAEGAAPFLDRSAVIYGPSGTGKSAMIRHIMGLLQPHIDQALVVSPTALSNGDYDGLVPRPLIHCQMRLADARGNEKQQAEDFLRTTLERQEARVARFTESRRPEVLEALFGRIPRERRAEGERLLALLAEHRASFERRLRDMYPRDPAVLEDKLATIAAGFERQRAELLRQLVLRQRSVLQGGRLDREERLALEYLDVCHRLLLVLDDCASMFKLIANNPSFRKMFYAGRHYGITLLVSCQDDTDLGPNLRRNAFLSIYTTEAAAQANLGRGGSSAQSREQLRRVCEQVFQGYRKLVYVREGARPYYSLTARVGARRRFGSPALWALCEQVGRGPGEVSSTNVFARRMAAS